MREWGPSIWGRRFTGAGEWTFQLDGDHAHLVVQGLSHSARVRGASPVVIARGVFWSSLSLDRANGEAIVVDGIPNRYASEIRESIQMVVVHQQQEAQHALDEARRTTRRERLMRDLKPIQEWRSRVLEVVKIANSQRLWITSEQTRAFVDSRPQVSISAEEMDAAMGEDETKRVLGPQYSEAQKAIAMLRADLQGVVLRRNANHTIAELSTCRNLFDSVEIRPLTDEQARAAICFDNRVLVVASAGSGKTSTIVAKAAYALHRGLFEARQIVLLAFNQSAAMELQRRMDQSLAALGMDGSKVEAKTFHALGIQILGEATGNKPRVPVWASDKTEGLRKISEIVERLRGRSRAFRTRWDMFRLVFGVDAPVFGRQTVDEGAENDLRTLKGERVRSFEECLIANWLFYNGVNYRYEARYEFATATALHSQYHPDFFYPELDLYHEHFALDADGRPPDHFVGYLEGVRWKRQEHVRRGTQCIETTSAELWTGKLFKKLASELKVRGVELAPNPDRAMPEDGAVPLAHVDLVDLIRCFICHAKSNDLDATALRARLKKMPKGSFAYRQGLFLDLVAPVREAWDLALAAEEGIDFEDMLNKAAEHLEGGGISWLYRVSRGKPVVIPPSLPSSTGWPAGA